MTRLLLDVQKGSDLDVLLQVLNRMKIPYSLVSGTEGAVKIERAKALAIIRNGCNMAAFGDASKYQSEQRSERAIPYRD